MQGWRSWTGTILMGLIALATLVIGGISIWFNEEPPLFPYPAKVLITTFAGGMTALAVAAMALVVRTGNRVAWMGLWAYPAFFLSHVAFLGTYIPDLILAVVSAAALVLLWTGLARSPTVKPAAA